MKLQIIFLIGAAILQATEAEKFELTGSSIFDSHSIFNVIGNAEESSETVLSAPTKWVSGSLTAFMNNLYNSDNPLYGVILNETRQAVVKLYIVRKEAEKMVETFVAKDSESIDDLADCLARSGHKSKAVLLDVAKNNTQSCIVSQYLNGVDLLQFIVKNFMNLINAPKPKLPSEDACKVFQKGYFDLLGAINKRDCLHDLESKLLVEAHRRFSHLRNIVIDIDESAQSIKDDMMECLNNGTAEVNDLKKEIINNCKNTLRNTQ